MELNRVIHKDLIDTKFKEVGQGLMTAISEIMECCEMHIFAMGTIGREVESPVYSICSFGNEKAQKLQKIMKEVC